MNALSAIASAIAEGASQLEADQELHIPIDEHRSVRLLRPAGRPGVMACVAQQPVGRTPAENDADLEALLRLGADTRWTSGLTGGLDAQGQECISQVLTELSSAQAIENTLAQMLQRLPSNTPAAAVAAPAMAAAWLRA